MSVVVVAMFGSLAEAAAQPESAISARLDVVFPTALPPEARLAEREPPVAAAPAEIPAPELVALAAWIRELEEAAEAAPSASNLHRRGVLRLYQGRFRDAVDDLRLALEHQGSGPEIAIDLANAYLARHAESGDPFDLALALERASQAVAAGPETLAAALMTRARALEALHLTRGAAADLAEAIGVEPSPGWRAIMEESSKRLEGELDGGRSPGLRDLLDGLFARMVDWSSEWTDPGESERSLPEPGEPEAALRELGAAPFVAALQVELESLAASPAAPLRALAGLPPRPRLGRCEDAVTASFGQARSAVRELAPTLSLWIGLYQSECLYLTDQQSAKALLDQVVSELGPEHRAIEGAVLKMRGLVRYARSDPIGAVADYQSARGAYEELDDGVGLMQVSRELADLFFELGEERRGWDALLDSLARSRSWSGPLRFGAVAILSERLLARRLFAAASEADRELEAAVTTPGLRVVALTARAMSAHRAGRVEVSRAAWGEAVQALAEVEGPEASWLRSDLLRSRAGLELGRGSAADALAWIEEAGRIDAAAGRTHEAHRDARVRGLALLARGELEAGSRELLSSLALNLERLDGGGSGSRLPELELDWLELLVDGWAERRPEEGLRLVLAVASALSPVQQGRRAEVLEARLSRPLPEGGSDEGAALVVYAFAPRDLVAWVLRDDGLHQRRIPLGRQDAATWTSRFRVAVALGAERLAREAASGLFERLIGPIEELIGPAERLRLVVEGPLLEVPFAALRDPRDGRFLVERWDLETWVGDARPGRASPAPAGGGIELLLVRGADPGAARLPELDREIAGIGGSRPDAALVEATALPAIREGMERARVVHVAGHLYADPLDPDAFSVPLPAGDEPLSSEQVPALDLGTVELVYLSTCRGRGSFELPPEPGYGLATAFLAAGARSVVASLWDLDDRAAAELALAFHRALAGREEAAHALGSAQRLAIARGEPVRAWAGLRLVTTADVRRTARER